MKFPLIHTGRRFFFFTFVVEGRRPVLSRLVRGERRPVLLPAGERVVAFWRRLHQIEPRFTASDFVIMPDHVHLLLIVNSEGEFRFNPLVFGVSPVEKRDGLGRSAHFKRLHEGRAFVYRLGRPLQKRA